jgi:hypothetical protein
MRMGLMALFVSLVLATAPRPSHAQRLSSLEVREYQAQQGDQGSVGGSIAAGIGTGLAGFLVGGLTASAMASSCTSAEYCQLEAAFYGAAAGGTLGMALGVHLGNHRQGNFALDFLTGAAVWGTGIGIAAASHWDGGAIVAAFVVIPLAQLATTVAVERAVGRSKARRLGVVVVPRLGGGATLAGSLQF